MNANDLKQQLVELYDEQSTLLQDNFDRNLSFQDTVFDRFERAKKLGFGNGASIYNSALVYGDVHVGEKTWIGPSAILDGSGGGIIIGAYCSISAGVHIYTHDTVMWALSGGEIQAHHAMVKIGTKTYIGAQSIIKAGVKIGSQCVIGANSFINKDMDDNTIVVGSPGRVVGKVVVKNGEIILDYKSV